MFRGVDLEDFHKCHTNLRDQESGDKYTYYFDFKYVSKSFFKEVKIDYTRSLNTKGDEKNQDEKVKLKQHAIKTRKKEVKTTPV